MSFDIPGINYILKYIKRENSSFKFYNMNKIVKNAAMVRIKKNQYCAQSPLQIVSLTLSLSN